MTTNNLHPFYSNTDTEIAMSLNTFLSLHQIGALKHYGVANAEHFIALLCHRELDMRLAHLLNINSASFNIMLNVLGMLEQQSEEDIEKAICTGFAPQGDVL